MLIIDCHGHYTTAPDAHQKFRDAQLARIKDPTLPDADAAAASATTRSARPSRRTSCKLQRERGADITLVLAARVGHGAITSATKQCRMQWTRACNDLIKRVVDLYPRELRRRLPAAAVAGRADRALGRTSCERCVTRARLRRLQPESRSVRRPLDRAAADRPALVSVLREDGRARRAGDDPRVGVVQPELPRHRRALHQRRHHGVHAVHRGRSVPAISRRCASSSRTAAARCLITGAAIAASPTC